MGTINTAIRRVQRIKDNFDDNMHKLIDTLAVEGAEIAQAAYGNFGVEAIPSTDETTGYIDVVGDMPLIAEFGAGDDTLDPSLLFENVPYTEVYPGSYSLLEGSQEYYRTGQWHFGGQKYHSVFPRQGLHTAKNYIIENSTEIAREVLKLD